MKKSFFLKEMGCILAIKIILISFIGWGFFSQEKKPNPIEVANTLFGQGEMHD